MLICQILEVAMLRVLLIQKNETEKYVCGLGLEGVFGGTFEWVEGVSINRGVWSIVDPDGSTRNVSACTTSGYIVHVAAEYGPFFLIWFRQILVVVFPIFIQTIINIHLTMTLFWRDLIYLRMGMPVLRARLQILKHLEFILVSVRVLLSEVIYKR